MPGRSFSAGSQYRYGFNGKENDPSISAGTQDYGMRISDTRLGRFLSVDPLTMSYPWYTPYQFAGNKPINSIDLDGLEPGDYTLNYQYKGLFDFGTKQRVDKNKYMLVSDSKIGLVDAELVYDKVKQQNFFITEKNGNYYYLKNLDGSSDVMTINPKTNDVLRGNFEPYETNDHYQARMTGKLADILSMASAALVVAPLILESAAAFGGPLAFSLPETLGIGALKFAAGAGGDLLAQNAIDPNAPINWWETGLSGGATTFGLHPYTGAFASNIVQQESKTGTYIYPTSDKWSGEQYAVTSIVQGAAGAAANKAFPNLGPVKGEGVSNNAVSTGLNAILNYGGTIAGSASGNATQ